MTFCHNLLGVNVVDVLGRRIRPCDAPEIFNALSITECKLLAIKTALGTAARVC